MSYKDNEITIINNYINILDKKWRLKRTLLIQYEINNSILLEDPKFRLILLAKHWFNSDKNDKYLKIILNPFLKKKDFDIIENIRNHHEKNIDTFFYLSFAVYFLFIRTSFKKKMFKDLITKFIFLSSLPCFLISYFFYLKPNFLKIKLNEFIEKNDFLLPYMKMDIDQKLIDIELIKYKIKI